MALRIFLTLTAALFALAFFAQMERAGLLGSIDRGVQSVRFSLASIDPSEDVVLVEIDKESLVELNTWPWPRRFHAHLLNQLMEMGAEDVAFDIDFSSKSNSIDDALFAEALERAGGYAYLAAFDQKSVVTGELLRSVPLDSLLTHAEPALVNIGLDQDGGATTFQTAAMSDGQDIQSVAAILGQPKHALPQQMRFDYRIDIRKVDRISYASVLNGTVNPNRIAGKQVVVGATAAELQDFHETARFGIMPGPLVLVLSIESVKSGVVMRNLGSVPSTVAVLVLLLFGAFIRGWRGRASVAGIGLIGIEITAIILLRGFHTEMSTTVSRFSIPTIFAISLISAGTVWLEQREAAQRRLGYLATHDANTGLYSYHGLIGKLNKDPQFSADYTIMLVAINRLGVVRGALGQNVASEAVREIGMRLGALFEAPIGLISEDVFVVALGGTLQLSEIEEHAGDIRYSLRVPYDVEETDILIDVEIAAANRVELGDTPDKIIADAQIALEDTLSGQTENTSFRLFSQVQREQIVARQMLDIEMRQAIDRNEFRLAFQPQIDLKSGQLAGVEALIRWHSEKLGVISPAEFVSLSEETGFIVELGTWVIEEACRIVAPWGWNGVLSVNVSALQLQMSDVPKIVEDALKATGYPANQLCLEITESVIVDGASDIGETLSKFHDIGVTVAIDDFGTGYSSLAYLSELNFDKLKIDQAFVRNVDQNPGNFAIVETVVSLAHKLGKTVIAEGMETAAEAKLIQQTGCEMGQGYFYGKPVDALILTERIMAAPAIAMQAKSA